MKSLKENGITLVALVVTIIILLILAGVTIGIVTTNNGLFSMTRKATESYQIASEREYLEQNVLSVQLDKYMGNVSSEKLGEALKTRNLENSANWHIVKVNDKSYETGWNYIEKGTELDEYGKAENSWLVNYETGEIIQLEENNYTSLSAGDMLAVKDSLIINVDSSIIYNDIEQTKESIEKQLGEGVELINFNYNDNSGLSSTSFNFDGVDDYIKVQYNKQEQKNQLAEQGFTFEFYGKWLGGTSYNEKKEILPNYAYRGLFCYWNGNEASQASFRFGKQTNYNAIKWSSGAISNAFSDYSEDKTAPWNIWYPIDNIENLNKDIYITITLDTSNEYEKSSGQYKNWGKSNITDTKEGEFYKQAVYINGKKLYEGDYNKKQWDDFITNSLPKLNYFCIGRSSMSGEGWWHYSKINAYCLRIYSRALTTEEVQQNYEKSVEYHSELTK